MGRISAISRENPERRERFTTREHARMRIFWYIECFYNPRRRHSSLDMLTPIEFEKLNTTQAAA